MLVRQLAISSPPRPVVAIAPADIGRWEGIYVLSPARTESFAYLDRVLGFAAIRWNGSDLELRPFQGAVKPLAPMGGSLFRARDRTSASQALLISSEGRRTISDGFRSYDRIGLWQILPLWASLGAEVLGLGYLVVRGAICTFFLRLRPSKPLFVPFVTTAALALPILLFLRQPFLQLGDLTPASALLALMTGALPLVMVFGLWWSVIRGGVDRSRVLDGMAMVAVLKWMAVLALWGLVPLRLWA